MDKIKQIWGKEKDISNLYLILGGVYLLLEILKGSVKYNALNFAIICGTLLINCGYMLLIRTSFGKKNFNKINMIIGILNIVGCIFQFINIIISFSNYSSFLNGFSAIIAFAANIVFTYYWLKGFNIFNGKLTNFIDLDGNFIFYILLILYSFYYFIITIIGIKGYISYVNYFNKAFNLYRFNTLVQYVVNFAMSVLFARFINLFIDFKNKKKGEN